MASMAMVAGRGPRPPGLDPVPTLLDLVCRLRDGDVVAVPTVTVVEGLLCPCSGVQAAMPERGTRTQCSTVLGLSVGQVVPMWRRGYATSAASDSGVQPQLCWNMVNTAWWLVTFA